MDRETFHRNVYTWFGEENSKSSRSFSQLTKLFSNYLDYLTFTPEFKYRHAVKSNKDFDHIIPRVVLEEMEADCDTQLAIGSPGNVWSIGLFENRSKRDKTYYQHKDLNLGIKLYRKQGKVHAGHLQEISG